MRMPQLEIGQSVLQRFIFGFIRLVWGDVPGPLLVMSYRQALFGNHFAKILQDTMRTQKHWTLGEMEVFATFVSKQNQCDY